MKNGTIKQHKKSNNTKTIREEERTIEHGKHDANKTTREGKTGTKDPNLNGKSAPKII